MLSVPNVSIITALHQRPVLQRPKPIPGDRSTMADNAEEAKASTNSSPSKASESKSSIKVPNFLSILTYLLLQLPVVMVKAIIFSNDVLNLRWRGAFQRIYLLGLEINEIMILSPVRTGMLKYFSIVKNVRFRTLQWFFRPLQWFLTLDEFRDTNASCEDFEVFTMFWTLPRQRSKRSAW